MRDQENETDPATDEPSRSQKRREALDVLKLAHALVELSAAQLARVPLSDELREEVARARAITQQIARKRQTQFLAKHLRRREDELEPIRTILEHGREHAHRETANLHRIEQWRDRLIAEGDEALTELLQQFPQADRQHLRQLARQARAERDANKPPQAHRELFRTLREMFDSSDA
jgi:ribosome-associated protein